MIIRSTAAYANEEAARSEQATLNDLDAISRGAYLNPTFIPTTTKEEITRASVDAHIKKVQAEQINQQTKIEMVDLEEQAKKFIGKKVKIIVIDQEVKPVESIWFNPNTGQYTNGVLNTRYVSGTIDSLMLDKNTLVLKPGFWSQIGASNRKFFMAYVINPDSLEPLISTELKLNK